MNLNQVKNAMRSNATMVVEGYGGEPLIRNNRYDVLPDWMGRLPMQSVNPIARQRLTGIGHGLFA